MSRALGKEFRAGNDAAAIELAAVVSGIDIDDAEMLIRAFTNYFQLVNLCEDSERVRRLKRRERENAPAPRRGSIREAIADTAGSRRVGGRAAGDAEPGPDATGADGASDRSAAANDDRQAGPDFPRPARPG